MPIDLLAPKEADQPVDLLAPTQKKIPSIPDYMKFKFYSDRGQSVRSNWLNEAMTGRMDINKAIAKGNSARDFWMIKAGNYENLELKEGLEQPVKFVAGEAASLVPYMVSSGTNAFKYGTVVGGGFAAIAAIAGSAGPQALFPEELITIPASFALGMKLGGAYGVLENMLKREGASFMGDMVEKGISFGTSQVLGVGVGTINGLLELAQFNNLSKPFKQAFAKVIQTKVGKSAIAQALGRYFKTFGINILQEDLQEVVPLVAETIAGTVEENPDAVPTKEEWAARLIEVTVRSAAGLAVIGAPGAAVDVARTSKANKIIKTEEDVAKLDEIIAELKGEEVVEEEVIEEPVVPKGEGEIYYHTTDKASADLIKEQGFKAQVGKRSLGLTKGKGIFLYKGDKKAAEIFGKNFEKKGEIPVILETKVEGKIFDAMEDDRSIRALAEDTKLIKQLKADGYVGIKGDEMGQEVIFIFEPKSIKLSQPKGEVAKVKPSQKFSEDIWRIWHSVKSDKVNTKAEIKVVQEEVIRGLEQSILEAKDKAKFIKTIKNIQTTKQLENALPKIRDRILQLEEVAKKDKTTTQIKKELKRAKPVKSGQKKVGKYDYESNKLFDSLRGYSKLTQEKAQTELDSYPKDLNTEMDLIKKRMLSLKANGKEASLEIHKQVFADIKRMKELGKEAKDQADFEKKVARNERVDEILATENKIKASKKSATTKFVNIYRKGFSNTYSMLNALFGKNIAEKYDPEIKENDRDSAVYYVTKKMKLALTQIYDVKKAEKVLEELATEDYVITDNEGLPTELSKLELIDIYNSLKGDLTRARYHNAFGKPQVETLMGNLTTQDVALADFLQETVQEYGEVLNKRSIETTGRDLAFRENYWMASSEFQVDVYDDIKMQGETPSAMKEMSKSSKVMPIPKNAWFKAQRHIAQGEHVRHLSREYETLKRLFSDRKIKHSIKQRFGEDVYNTLMDQLDNIALNKQTQKIDAISGWFGNAINNWVTAKIAFNPSTFVRQLMSVGNYMENVNSVKWTQNFFKGIKNPKQTFKFMWDNAPFLEARFHRGYSEALNNAIKGAEKINKHWGNWAKFLSSFARVGDITAIVYGGYGMVQTQIEAGVDPKVAFKNFEKATLKSQQSGLSSSLSQYQNQKNSFTRLFLAFKNTSNQYFRKMVDAMISYGNGDISKAEFTKIMSIYAVIQPTLYVLAGVAVKQFFAGLGGRGGEDLEDVPAEVLTQMVISPVLAIPVLDDLATFAIRHLTGQKAWKAISLPLLDDLGSLAIKAKKKEKTAGDYFAIIAGILEPTTGLPVNMPLRLKGYIKGKKKKGLQQI